MMVCAEMMNFGLLWRDMESSSGEFKNSQMH